MGHCTSNVQISVRFVLNLIVRNVQFSSKIEASGASVFFSKSTYFLYIKANIKNPFF